MPLSEAPQNLQEAAVDDPRLCNQCGQKYEHLASHWGQSSTCEWPDISDDITDMLTGIIMGDGYVDGSGGNANVEIIMTNPKYLSHIDDILGNLSTGVRFYRSAEKSAKMNRDNGFSPDASAENYKDKYRLRTVSHPHFNQFLSWYEGGKKVWPEDIHLSPNVLKHWYVCDGSLNTYSSNRFMRISTMNEVDNKEKVEQMFESSSLPAPDNWEESRMVWGAENTKEILNYMGKSPPGFKYKWL